MRRAIAVFDIDGTLIRDSSAERIFIRYLLHQGELNLASAISFVGRLLVACPRGWDAAIRRNKFYLRGKSRRRTERLAARCFKQEITPRISAAARGKIAAHRVCGLEIVLLSGTLDVLLRCFCEELGADRAHGSALSVVEGRYTGGIEGIHPYGKAKTEIVQACYGSDCYDLSASYAYANHITDLEFLKLFGHPVFVNPSARLAARARKMGIGTTHF